VERTTRLFWYRRVMTSKKSPQSEMLTAHGLSAQYGTLQCVAMHRVSNHPVSGSTNGSTIKLMAGMKDSQRIDWGGNIERVRDGIFVLPKQMRYQTAPCPVPIPRS
jgi:hypothetical protein